MELLHTKIPAKNMAAQNTDARIEVIKMEPEEVLAIFEERSHVNPLRDLSPEKFHVNSMNNAPANSTTSGLDALRDRVSSNYASKANPAVKEVIIRYDDKNGRPTSDEEVF